MTDHDSRALQEAHQQVEACKRAPLAERKENAAHFLEVMREQPSLIAERIEWLIAGNYGYGQMLNAKRTLASRGNKEAQLNVQIACCEWSVPADLAIAAWKKLSAAEKKKLDAAIKKVIKHAEKE